MAAGAGRHLKVARLQIASQKLALATLGREALRRFPTEDDEG